jgi:uncharacterized protein YkwD
VLETLLATAAIALAHGAGAPPCAGAHERGDPVRRRHAVQCLVNDARAAHGLRRLRPAVTLGRAAGAHARDMRRRGFFEHRGADGSTPQLRARRAGYRGSTVGETIALSTGSRASAAAVVRRWLRSPGHRRVLLDPRMRHAGVGLADGVRARRQASGTALVLDVGAP